MWWTGSKIEIDSLDMDILTAPPFSYGDIFSRLFESSDKRFPPVFSASVFVLLSVHPRSVPVFWREYRKLLDCSNHPERHYRSFFRYTGSKKRKLHEADATLLTYQGWIHRNILKKAEFSSCAAAYCKGKSVLDNASPHVGNPYALKLDIRNFFDFIKKDDVYCAFEKLTGYSKEVLALLTSLCCKDGCLPQGAATSPAISNLVMRDFDDWLIAYCKERELVCTRYSDDITVSGKELKPGPVISDIRSRLSAMGFSLNEEKTRFLGKGTAHKITGVVCNEKTAAPIAYRKKLRQEMYYIQRFGFEEHFDHVAHSFHDRESGRINPASYLRGLLGKINYVLFLSPENEEFRGYKEYIERYMRQQDIEYYPFNQWMWPN